MKPTITNVRGLGDFAPIYNFDINIVFPNIQYIGGQPTPDGINWRCQTTDLPKMTGQSIEINIRGHKVKQPGIYNYSNTLTLAFVETVDNVISNFFKSWREACWATDSGAQYQKVDVEAIITLVRLNRQDESIYHYTLYGCYLEDYEAGGTMDGSASDVVKPTMTISYDFFDDGPGAA